MLGATLDAQPTEVLHDRLRTLDPVGAARMTTSNRRRIVRALEVTIGSGRPFSSFGPGLETYPPTPFRLIGVALPPDVVGRRIAERYQRQLEDGFLDEVRRLRASPGGLSRTASQALGYKELAAHLRRGTHTGRRRRDRRAPDAAIRSPAAGLVPSRSADRVAVRELVTPTRSCPPSRKSCPARPGDGHTWRQMRLTKHHGLGNDFLVLLDLDSTHTVDGSTARTLCDRHRGVGADGLLHVTAGPPSGGRAADVTMRLFNADGGRAEMSGNGISCLAQAVVLANVSAGPVVTVSTDAGLRTVRIEPTDTGHVHLATVDMGAAKVGDDEPGRGRVDNVRRAVRVDIGNPHLVLEVGEPWSDDELVARGVRINALVPAGINVELVRPDAAPNELHMQVYERGVGLTEACGTGACAAAAAAHRWGLIGTTVRVHQPGGPADIVLGDTIEMTVPVVHIATIDVPQ